MPAGADVPHQTSAPAPGLAGATALPLPPQAARVPGATLAPPPLNHDAAAWAPAEREQPPPSASVAAVAPSIPSPRTPSDDVVSGRVAVPHATGQDNANSEPSSDGTPVSASASVPLASRVMPPTDYTPQSNLAPRSRVYGRPSEPEAQPDSHEQPAPAPPAGFAPWAPPPAAPAAPVASPDQPSGPGATSGPTTFGPATATPHPGGGYPSGWAPPQQQPDLAGRAAPEPVHTPPAPSGEPGFPPPPGFTTPTSPAPTGDAPSAPSWTPPAMDEQERFNAFAPEAAPSAAPEPEEPTPQVRNGRVLLAVLTAAVLILAIPLGTLQLLGKLGGGDEPTFNPAIGSCVKQSGDSPAPVDCGDDGAYEVVSKVDDKADCDDPALPYIELSDGGKRQYLCLSSPTVDEGASTETS
ncbi:MAG TPA: hypothetical protein VFX60_07580 [Micromonospora sp.]|nr:hypothetical protein [Micromonospora sp.]